MTNPATLLTAFILLSTPCVAQTVSVEQWSADLDTMVETIIKGHKNPYHTINKKDFDSAVTSLRKRLPELTDGQRTVEFMRLVARIGDGHTAVYTDFSNFRVFPISLYSFDDGLFVTAATDKKLVGSRVVSINGKPIGDVKNAFAAIISHDNAQSLRHRFQQWVNIAEFLHGTGVIDSPTEATFEFEKDGRKSKATLQSIINKNLKKMKWESATPDKLPLYQRNRRLNQWNDWLADHKTIYFKYNRCQDMAGFAKLTRGTIGFMKENDVQRFVLDLRDNPGGNSAIFLPLLLHLRLDAKLNQRGKLFVITGRRTFSSGLWNAVEMKTKTNAVFIGEPTGGKPNHYGEVGKTTLPNTGLTVVWSKKYHTLLKGEDPESLIPDVHVKFNAADFFAGRDPYLKAALEYTEPDKTSR